MSLLEKALKKKESQEQKSIEPKKIEQVKNIEKQKIIAKKPEKSILSGDFDFNVSGIKVTIELNENTSTRTKSGILKDAKVKNYSNMRKDELDNELSKLLTKGILKTLKGVEADK